MSASGEKFTPSVQGCPLWSKHNEIFFLETKFAGFCGGVKTWTLFENFPCDFILDICPF